MYNALRFPYTFVPYKFRKFEEYFSCSSPPPHAYPRLRDINQPGKRLEQPIRQIDSWLRFDGAQ